MAWSKSFISGIVSYTLYILSTDPDLHKWKVRSGSVINATDLISCFKLYTCAAENGIAIFWVKIWLLSPCLSCLDPSVLAVLARKRRASPTLAVWADSTMLQGRELTHFLCVKPNHCQYFLKVFFVTDWGKIWLKRCFPTLQIFWESAVTATSVKTKNTGGISTYFGTLYHQFSND